MRNTRAGGTRPEFRTRDGRPLYRGCYNGYPYMIYRSTLGEEMVSCDEEARDYLGWCAMVIIPGARTDVADYPATCVDSFAEAEAATREFIGEGITEEKPPQFTDEQKACARAANAAIGRALFA